MSIQGVYFHALCLVFANIWTLEIDKIKSKCFTITMDFQKLPFQSAIFSKTVCFIFDEVFDKDDLHIAYKEQSFVARKD